MTRLPSRALPAWTPSSPDCRRCTPLPLSLGSASPRQEKEPSPTRGRGRITPHAIALRFAGEDPAAPSRLISSRPLAGEKAFRPPDEDDDHDGVDDEAADRRDVVFAGDVGDAEDQRRDERAGQRAGAADGHHDQEIDEELERETRVEAEELRAERAAQPGQPGTDGEGDGKEEVDLDAEAAGDAAVVDAGAEPAAEARP